VRGKLADVAAAAAGTLAHLDASASAGLEGTLEDLRACGKLERLVLDGCKRVGGSVAALAKLEHLVELRLDDTAALGDVKELRGLASLEHLSLRLSRTSATSRHCASRTCRRSAAASPRSRNCRTCGA
jgi:hypothetical protein